MIRYAYSRWKAVKYFFIGLVEDFNFWLRCDGHALAVFVGLCFFLALLTAKIAIMLNGK